MRSPALLCLLAVGCASGPNPADSVRVTSNPDVVRGCQFVGNVRGGSWFGGGIGAGKSEDDLKSGAVELGGNTVYIAATSSGRHAYEGSSASGEAYRCP